MSSIKSTATLASFSLFYEELPKTSKKIKRLSRRVLKAKI